jgi:hypothetical protein
MAEYTQQTALSKTMAARGLVNGRGPRRRRGRDLVFDPPLPTIDIKVSDSMVLKAASPLVEKISGIVLPVRSSMT